MNMLDIRNKVERALVEAGFVYASNAGCLLVPPYTADIDMRLGDDVFKIEITPRDQLRARVSLPDPAGSVTEIAPDGRASVTT